MYANLRECWILSGNRRISQETPWSGKSQIHAIVVETVKVDKEHRRQGHLKRFLEVLCSDARYEMVVVEDVQNPILAEALLRWGWEVDTRVMDFYRMKK
jgi:hypothetical protein